MEEEPVQRVIRDKAFAKRLAIACENHTYAPSGHGRQVWVRTQLHEMFGIKLSPEAVRRWFAGEARPRPKIMSHLAQALEVDEAWLSLGISPAATPREQEKLNAMAGGAVNLVAGLIQLSGGSIAYPDDGAFDLFAIVRGKSHQVTVRLGDKAPSFKLSIPNGSKTVIAVVPTDDPLSYQFVRVPAETLTKHGRNKGGYLELDVEREAANLNVAGEPLPQIQAFAEIDGVMPTVPTQKGSSRVTIKSKLEKRNALFSKRYASS